MEHRADDLEHKVRQPGGPVGVSRRAVEPREVRGGEIGVELAVALHKIAYLQVHPPRVAGEGQRVERAHVRHRPARAAARPRSVPPPTPVPQM